MRTDAAHRDEQDDREPRGPRHERPGGRRVALPAEAGEHRNDEPDEPPRAGSAPRHASPLTPSVVQGTDLADPAAVGGGEQVGDDTDLVTDAQHRLRVGREPGGEDEGPLVGPRMREGQVGVLAADLARAARRAVLDEVEVEGARPPAHLAGPAVPVLDRDAAGRAGERGPCRVRASDDGIEVCRLVRSADRVGLERGRDDDVAQSRPAQADARPGRGRRPGRRGWPRAR